MLIDTWAQQWGVQSEAVAALKRMMLSEYEPAERTVKPGMGETPVQQRVELAFATDYQGTAWRNNVAVFMNDRGTPVRTGLANVSAKMNKRTKSGDLIGIYPLVIRPDHVGKTLGLFCSFECKKAAWKWSGDEHEVAQSNWAGVVTALGGFAMFINDPAQLQVLRSL